MLIDKPRAALRIATRPPRVRLDQHLDFSPCRNPQQAEAEQATELANPRVALPASHRAANRQPDLVARGRPVHTLKDKFKIEAELEFGDDDQGRSVGSQRDNVAAIDLALYLEAELLKEAFDGKVEGGFQAELPTCRPRLA